METQLKRFHLYILLISILLYTLTAFYSLGYYYFDEQYQILEFANLKLGLTEAEYLAWEYHAKIRPAVQPFIYIAINRTAGLFGKEDPYTLAFITRILTMAFSLTTIRFFVISNIESVSVSFKKHYILCSYLIWFIPFLSVRFASETWSGNFLLLAMAMVIRMGGHPGRKQAYCGVFVGLAFIFRFQSAFGLVGLVAYAYFIGRHKLLHISIMFLTAGLVLTLSTLLDWWFYETLTFTPLNYFEVNIINGVASAFGTSPWDFYFRTILSETILPIGIVMLALPLITVLKRPKHIAVWVMVPFLLLHITVPHKELRFLFPLINIIPILLILGMEVIFVTLRGNYNKLKILAYLLAICLVVINLLALAVMVFRPMRNGEKVITSYIFHAYPDQKISVIYEKGPDPFNPLGNVRENTYYQKNLSILEQSQVLDGKRLPDASKPILFICSKNSYDFPNNQEIIMRYKLKLKLESIPLWIQNINSYVPGKHKNGTLMLFSRD